MRAIFAGLLAVFGICAALTARAGAQGKDIELDYEHHYTSAQSACAAIAKRNGEDKTVDHPYNTVAGAEIHDDKVWCKLTDKNGNEVEQHYGSVTNCADQAPPYAPGSTCLTATQPDLMDAKASGHTLGGDSTGGGHRAGTGVPKKSEFPADWSDEKIQGVISDIATDPKSVWSTPNPQGRVTTEGVRDGIRVKVVYDQNLKRIVTGFPTNVPKNPPAPPATAP